MDQTLSILDTNSLDTLEGAERFALTRPKSELRDFTDGIRQAMVNDARSLRGASSNKTLDEANYLPGSSIRGDSGCFSPTCRLPKIQALARYIALYCDRAVIPIRLQPVGMDMDHAGETLDRIRLMGGILGIMELRPLIESGLAVLIPEELRLCEEHWNKFVPERKKIINTARRLADTNARRFSVTYHPAREFLGHPTLEYKGPEDFLEHGQLNQVLDSVPDWIQLGSRRMWSVRENWCPVSF
jgi:hypothetical protein